MQDYRIPRQRALKWLELARGVGPCPRQLNGSTITIRYIRIPRTTKQLFEIVETAPRIDAAAAVAQLTSEHGFTIDKAKKVLNSAWQRGQCSISEHGAVHYHGRGSNDSYIYSIEDGWEIDR
jgi:hypothetical protein